MGLERGEIVRAALGLLDEAGLDGVSTRALAVRLGVQQPALYWHFRSKRALMDAMNAQMLREAHRYRVPRGDEDWRAFLAGSTRSFRAALLSRRDGARLHAGARAEASDRAAAECQLRFLAAQGFGAGEALGALVTLSRFTVGSVLEEQAEAAHAPVLAAEEGGGQPLLAEAFRLYRATPAEVFFAGGLEAIVAGLRR